MALHMHWEESIVIAGECLESVTYRVCQKTSPLHSLTGNTSTVYLNFEIFCKSVECYV